MKRILSLLLALALALCLAPAALGAGGEEAAAAGVSLTTPKWQTTQYSVLLSRENGQWHIRNLTVSRLINDE